MPIGDPSALPRTSSDVFYTLPHAEHHKYQTIQSFRPEEVKELLQQHFLDPAANGRTSAPNEEGVRRFSLVKNNFKVRRAIRNSKDAAMLRGMVDEGTTTSSSAPTEPNHFAKLDTAPDEAHRHPLMMDQEEVELDAAHEIARLRAQLVHERTIYTREMARMRAQVRAFEAHLAQTVARMGSLLEMVDAREKAVQDLLLKNIDNVEDGDRENERETEREKDRGKETEKEKETEKGKEREKDKKVDLPAIKLP
jgi:hypothetical protein